LKGEKGHPETVAGFGDPTILPLENRSVWLYSVKT
jgi:hypothetical protein